MRFKRILCAALVAAMAAVPVLFAASCGNGGTTATTAPVSLASGAAQQTTASDPLAAVPANNFNGQTFMFLDRGLEANTHWNNHDIYAESENGASLNDAVYKRNVMVQDRYNVAIKETQVNANNISSTVSKSVQAGANEYQAIDFDMTALTPFALKGYYTDFAAMPILDLSAPCWDGFVNDSISINHRYLFIEGDLNIGFNDSNWIVMFDKTLSDNLGLANQYQTVTDGTWTIDLMWQNCKAATKDLNGDGVFDETDQWGAVNQHECMYSLYASTGQHSFTKDANDMPVCAMDATSDQLTILQDVYNFLNDKSAQIKADDYSAKYPTDPWTAVNINTFKEGRALYYISPVVSVSMMRDMDADFGLLPMPKSGAGQTDYYDTVQYNNAEVIAVPITNTDAEFTGTVLQAMGLASGDTVKTAYYDVQLKTKYARDDDSASMLDIIFKNRIVDIGLAFNWGGCYDFYSNFSKDKSFDYASAYAKISKKIDSDMAKAVAAFTA